MYCKLNLVGLLFWLWFPVLNTFFFLLPVFPISLPSVFQILVIDYVPDMVFVDDVNFHFLLSFHEYFSEKLGEVILTDTCKMQI